MNKNDFAKLALMGLAGGLLLNGKMAASNDSNSPVYTGQGWLSQLKELGKNLDKSMALAANQPANSKNSSKSGSTSYSNKSDDDANTGNMGYHLMSQDELLLELNDEGTRLYNSLSPQGKALAREVASQRCNGTNTCRGLNACETETNKCAGQGSCKGKSKCAFADKNLAVKVVWEKMQGKRNKALQFSQ